MFVRRFLRPGDLRTLDAGSGNGGFAMYAARRGNHALGISFDAGEVAAAKRRAALLGLDRAEFMLGDLRTFGELGPELGEFDQILCLEVVEHLLEDARLLADLANVLRPGGRLILTTPTASHRPLLRERLSTCEDGGHVRWGYADDALIALVEQAGLRVVKRGHISGVIPQQLTNLMRALSWFTWPSQRAAWGLVLPLRLLQMLDRPLTRALGWSYLSVAVVAVRDSR